MHLQNFENFGNECAKIKNQFLIFRKSLCKIAGNPWKSILKSINQNAFFFPGKSPLNFEILIILCEFTCDSLKKNNFFDVIMKFFCNKIAY
jgi:hypothetical protein